MKKLTIFALFILLLAACNSPQDTSPTENEEPEQEEQTEEAPEETTENGVEEDTEVNEEEPILEEKDSLTQEEDSNKTNESAENGEAESDEHQELVDLTNKIFEAQNNKDYDFLQSVLSKGSKLDKKNNKFIFENVTYPHDQEFLTEKNTGDLELRYTHENSADSVIVGFAAIDYENESSFVIDFEFIREDGNWKMNDMDINK